MPRRRPTALTLLMPKTETVIEIPMDLQILRNTSTALSENPDNPNAVENLLTRETPAFRDIHEVSL
jgi:hypothetical protein